MRCKDPVAIERFYSKHFGFTRGRVYAPGPSQVVVINSGGVALEFFPASGERPGPRVGGAGPEYPSVRHIAFIVNDLDRKLAPMGADAMITLGPAPEGNIVELNQGYVDEVSPTPFQG